MTAELQKKIESEMLKALEPFIGRTMTPDVRAQVQNILIGQLRQHTPDAPIDLEAIADPKDPTCITIIPKNAWTGLTLTLADKYPDALPVSFNATEVATPIGTFRWDGTGVVLELIPPAKPILLGQLQPVPPDPTSVPTPASSAEDIVPWSKQKQEYMDIMHRESMETADLAIANLPKTFSEAGDRIWRAFRAGQRYAQAQDRLQQLKGEE